VAAQEAGRGQLTPIVQKDIPYHLMSCSTIKAGDTYTVFVLNDNLFLLLLFQIFLPVLQIRSEKLNRNLAVTWRQLTIIINLKTVNREEKLLKKKEKIQSFF